MLSDMYIIGHAQSGLNSTVKVQNCGLNTYVRETQSLTLYWLWLNRGDQSVNLSQVSSEKLRQNNGVGGTQAKAG